MKSYTSIKEYIADQPKVFQPILKEVYKAIKNGAPKAEETIKYGMPTFVGNKNLVHFALAKKHLGFYPTPSAVTFFKNEFAPYKTSKGAVQFPLDKPMPLKLITKVTQFRVKEDSKLGMKI
jgi:uncharacterized protein YdhG (YjbR/CyaY superfamily)